MIFILHGDDIVSSRKRLTEITSSFKNVAYLDAEKIFVNDLIQALGSSDMFGDKKCVVVEKVLKLKKPELEKLLDLLENLDSSSTVILWHNTDLSKVFLGKFKKVIAKSFMLPKLFFTFLDNLSPNNFKNELDILSKMQNVEAEQIFYAMVKRIRQLLALKMSLESEELSRMSPWQKDKLRNQGSKWKAEELEGIYRDLYKIELKLKSGGLMLPLKKHIDIMLIQQLN
jgi:DNA polymerase III delta subunit